MRILDLGSSAAGVNADVVFRSPGQGSERGWLECLQYTAYTHPGPVGIVGARLIDSGGRIAHAGLCRDRAHPDRFVSYYGGQSLEFGPADVRHPVLAVAGDCMYVKRELVERIGASDPSTMYGAVDFCLRAWKEGYDVLYEPASILERTGKNRPPDGDGQRFWRNWRRHFDERDVHAAEDKLRIVYVTEGTGLWGGHRVVFEDLNQLAARGHDVALFTLEPPPDWIELHAPVHKFDSYDQLTQALAPLDAIKVATWWQTALPVWRASVLRGIPVYFVQDIESSYYPDSEAARHMVLASYRSEFRYLTTSTWNRDRLAELGHESALIAPAIDRGTFRPLPAARHEAMILAIARPDRLKRFDLTVAAWQALPEPRPELRLFGRHPELAPPGAHYLLSPADSEVNDLLNRCAVFVQTSAHEGFALPALEAMAAGAAVVCTDAHGNRDYCVDGVNCLMPDAEPAAIAGAISALIDDPVLRARLGAAGIETARQYRPEQRIDELEGFMRGVATSARRRAAPRA